MFISTRLLLASICVLAALSGYRCDEGAVARTINDDPNPLVLCVPDCERPIEWRIAADASGSS